MIYSNFKDCRISKLGFGAMRLPLLEDKSIDHGLVKKMVGYAMEHGVNYFDTAYPYHNGFSETALREALAGYDRSSYYLADKYPGHQIADSYDPEEVFEDQLKKCGVEYFDFYLLHNVNEASIGVYMDEKWGILPYFLKQKEAGRIRHLGFSTHARTETLQKFLDYAGDKMEFCQIQLNYVDWTLQNAQEKCRMLRERGIPVWVMEPVRGGRLADLNENNEKLKAAEPDKSIASWAFRWLLRNEDIGVILSGMSDLEQMIDNISTFEEGRPLTDEESGLVLQIAESMKNSVPCTGCRYCCDVCPMELDIPAFMGVINDLRFGKEGGLTANMQIEFLPEDKKPSACVSCGSCMQLCPQNIEIPEILAELAERSKDLPSWRKISEQRNEEAARQRQER